MFSKIKCPICKGVIKIPSVQKSSQCENCKTEVKIKPKRVIIDFIVGGFVLLLLVNLVGVMLDINQESTSLVKVIFVTCVLVVIIFAYQLRKKNLDRSR